MTPRAARTLGRAFVLLAFLPTLLLLSVMPASAVVGDCGSTTWYTYAPTWASDGTAPTIGNGTLDGRYRAIDSNRLAFAIRWVRGSTTSNGSGTYTLSLPSGYTIASGYHQAASAFYNRAGTGFLTATGIGFSAGSALYLAIGQNTSGAVNQLWGSTYPFTPATGDELVVSGELTYAASCPTPSPAPTGTPVPTASAMTIDAFTGTAATAVQQGLDLGLIGFGIVVSLLAALLVMTLRR